MRLQPLEKTPFPCGYFKDRDATYEHFFVYEATLEEREQLFSMGYRNFGSYVFKPVCKDCRRCVPLRLNPKEFVISQSQKRVLKKCQNIRVAIGPPVFTAEKQEIYVEHHGRFSSEESPMSAEEFVASFYHPSVPGREFCYYLDDKLVAVGITQETEKALSSVYFMYQESVSKLSLGTFSILKEIEYCQNHDKELYYLGYYIHQNRFMKYKGEFRPSEVITSGTEWVPFRDKDGEYYLDPEEIGWE